MWENVKTWLAGDAGEELSAFRFEFNVPMGTGLAFLLLLAVAIGAALYCWPRLAKLKRPFRLAVVALRVAVFVLALFMLLDPCIVGQRIKPGEHYVIVLFDNSKSMQIIGDGGQSRGERLIAAYDASRAEFEEKILGKYQMALYGFGDGIERLQDVSALDFTRRETDLTGAIEEAMRDLEGINVSGIVIFSDGIHQSPEGAANLERLSDGEIPIFTVGTGTEAEWRDIEIGTLSVRRTGFDKSPVILTAPIKATGLAGSEAIVEVLLDGRTVKSETFEISDNDQDYEVRLEFVPVRKGWLEYEARVRLAETGSSVESGSPQDSVAVDKDQVAQNNSRRFVVDNREKIYRILYFTGRPNWENKFVNRAMADDKELYLTSLIRISGASREFVFRGRRSNVGNSLFDRFDGDQDMPRWDEAVFLRLNIRADSPEGSELEKNYPLQPEQLFPFDLVIWGEIESEFFSQSQLELTRDFVRKRGGSLLLLGGGDSFTEGDFDGTIIETMLPVVLPQSKSRLSQRDFSSLTKKFSIVPTVDGELEGAWALDPNPEENHRLWDEMPLLSGVNLFVVTRAGATVMARASSSSVEVDEAPLFAVQRYGEGKTAILATGSTWQYQLNLDFDVDDDRHQRLWRQIVRSLVKDVPKPVYLRTKEDAYIIGNPIDFEIVMRDALYDEREGLRTTMMITAPSGEEILLAVDESIHETGLYSSQFIPDELGTHLLTVTALDDKDEVVGTLDKEAFLVEPDQREFQNAQYNPALLKEIANETNGEFFSLDRLGEIVPKIPWIDRENPEEVRIHLWHFPIFLFAMIAMLGVEWFIRRKKGYA